MLEKQKEMTTNRLLDSEMVFDINQIHVPLALVERKKQDKRQGDDYPDKSHSYKPEYDENQKFNYEKFLAILKTRTNKKIAITGEPGTGKTTLLQRIAFWVLENTNDLAIWISLGNLPTTAPNFKDYLLNNWLQNAIQSVTPEIKADFDKQLTAGKVWLLLDGVDEMATSGNALSFINNWLPAWSHNLHFVLTCRLNVWEANPNYLSGFQTYRTLQFNQEQVKQFINNCFQNRGNHALGKHLQQALNQSGKERIKDLIRNPLRLMLLCSSWHSLDGKLPDTKAELYQHFVDEVYRWKKDELKITPQQRNVLNAKLKKLALAAIDKEENRFSLRQKFVESVLGECDDELFQFALKVGWLNRVGVDAKNKPVYAFFHPTFQEYFAALAIEDWAYFLNHVPDNPAQGIYRIFEPQWKEVILLWLGREEVGKEEKEEFIKALVEFEDGIKYDFYRFRAYFLAANGIAEFRECHLAHKIVRLIIDISFGIFNRKKQRWVRTLEPIAEIAKEALKETDRTRTIPTLINFLPFIMDEDVQQEAASSLGQIDPGNSLAIETLIHLGRNAESELTRKQAFESLRQIAKGNPLAIQTLVQLIQTTENDEFLFDAVQSLGEIGEDDPLAIKILTKLVQKNQDECLRCIAACDLKQIEKDNHLATQTLNELAQTAQKEFIRQLATRSLEQDKYNRQPAAQKDTGIIDESFKTIIEAMMQTPENELAQDSKLMRNLYATLLVKNLQGDYLRLAVFNLKNCLTDQVYKNDRQRFQDCYSVIWHCAQNMTYRDFHKAWHSTP